MNMFITCNIKAECQSIIIEHLKTISICIVTELSNTMDHMHAMANKTKPRKICHTEAYQIPTSYQAVYLINKQPL